jgi:hypothetical protein
VVPATKCSTRRPCLYLLKRLFRMLPMITPFSRYLGQPLHYYQRNTCAFVYSSSYSHVLLGLAEARTRRGTLCQRPAKLPVGCCRLNRGNPRASSAGQVVGVDGLAFKPLFDTKIHTYPQMFLDYFPHILATYPDSMDHLSQRSSV